MSTIAGTIPGARTRQDCSAAGNVTRSLLGYLALAGPFYVVVSLAQALTGTASTWPATNGACSRSGAWAGSSRPTSS
jgi:hypothetical protein